MLTLCVLLSEWCVRFGAGHRDTVGMPLQGAGGRVLLAVRVVCTVWSDAGGAQVAAAGAD